MFKKLFVVVLMTALTLSACGNQAPTETPEIAAPTPTETQPAPTTESPVEQIPVTGETEVLGTETPTPEATVTPPRPENQPGCINQASFVTDVTIPDNTVVDAGSTFTKTWRIGNTGTCIWAWDYVLTYYSENRMGAPDEVPLDITYPGQTIDISVELTAPSSPGTYRGNFVIENPDGLIMKVDEDSRLWLITKVENTAPTATTAATSNVAPTSAASTSTSGPGAGGATCSFATDVFKLTDAINTLNAYRAQNGLPNYTVNTLLVRAAQRHANDMACNNLFVHTGSDGSTPQTRVAATGYVASSVTENVYGSYPPLDGQGAINWWATDTTDLNHNKNLLSTTYTEIGVGYAFFNNYGYYVIVFAKP